MKRKSNEIALRAETVLRKFAERLRKNWTKCVRAALTKIGQPAALNLQPESLCAGCPIFVRAAA